MKRYHHGNLRSELIANGLNLISEKGVKAFTLREIGIRAGVSRMAAYRHFADKADLLKAICEAGFTKFADALDAARLSAGASFTAQLNAMGVAYVRFASENQAHYEVMFGIFDPAVQSSPSADRAFHILEETIRQGQAAGEFRPGNSVVLAQFVWAAVHGISTLHLNGADFLTSWQEILLTGLSAPHSTVDSTKQPTK